MLDLVLEKKTGLSHATLGNCKAEIELAPEKTEEPKLDPVKATGVFSLVNSGNAVDVAITARGDLHRDATTEPKDIKVTLKADATITVAFAEGETEVDTGIVWEKDGHADKEPSVKPESITASVKQDGVNHPNTLRLTRTDGSKAARIPVTLLGIEVAKGCGRDNNCDGPLTIKKVGEAHIDALCNWESASGLKANPTHFRISTVNAHEKIYSLSAEKTPGAGA